MPDNLSGKGATVRTRPTITAMSDPDQLLTLLEEVYEDLAALKRTQLPSTVPALKAVTLATHLDLRRQVGDLAGQLGPRAIIVGGRTGPLDGGEGVFVWDPTSQLADDDAAVMQPFNVGTGPGRWRKGSF